MTNRTNRTELRHQALPSEIDAQENVIVWDHGPSAPLNSVPREDPRWVTHEAELRAWQEKTGGLPQRVVLHVSQAAHAMKVEPQRYAMEPDVDDAEINAEVDIIVKKRAEVAKVAEDRAIAAQLVIDRKAAIAIVMARRVAKAADDKAKAIGEFARAPDPYLEPATFSAPEGSPEPYPVEPSPVVAPNPAPFGMTPAADEVVDNG
jgi:hypothetical protein